MKIVQIILLVFIVLSCNQNQNDQKNNNQKMSLKENSEIKEISKRLRHGMIDFIEPGKTSYTENDVKKCMDIISKYLREIEITDSKEKAMKIVEKAVLSLNELNKNCKYELIETDQREDIVEIIILAGNLKGFNSRNNDITEDWREW